MGCANRKEEANTTEASNPNATSEAKEEAKKAATAAAKLEETKQQELEDLKMSSDDFLAQIEDSFYLNSLDLETLASAVRTSAVDYALNSTQFQQALLKCGLTRNQLDDNSYLVQFNEAYNCNITTKKFSCIKLVLLSILLSDNLLNVKSKTLYQLCDIDSSNSISISEMSAIIEQLLKIALVELPAFAITKLNKIKQRKLSRTIKMYQKVYLALSEFYLRIMMGSSDELDEEQFMKNISTTKAVYLTSAKQIRAFAIETFDRHREYELILTHMTLSNRALESEIIPELEVRARPSKKSKKSKKKVPKIKIVGS